MAKTKGVVAAGHELTAKAAAEILEDGGNAFDACVAGLYMTFVAEAVFASPGGGGFLMARRAGSGKIALYDFFAQTPKQKRHERDIAFACRNRLRHPQAGEWIAPVRKRDPPIRHRAGRVGLEHFAITCAAPPSHLQLPVRYHFAIGLNAFGKVLLAKWQTPQDRSADLFHGTISNHPREAIEGMQAR